MLHQNFDLGFVEVLDLKELGDIALQLLLESLSGRIVTLIRVRFDLLVELEVGDEECLQRL